MTVTLDIPDELVRDAESQLAAAGVKIGAEQFLTFIAQGLPVIVGQALANPAARQGLRAAAALQRHG